MREARKAQGKCILCGTRNALQGVKYCWKCSEGCKDSVLSRRAERSEQGLCIFCGERKPDEDSKSCSECKKKINDKYEENKKT